MHVVLCISIRFQSCKALFETPCISDVIMYFRTFFLNSVISICDHATYTFLAICSPCIIEIDNVAPVLKGGKKKPLFKLRTLHSKEFFCAIRSKAFYPFLGVCGGGGGNIGSSL